MKGHGTWDEQTCWGMASRKTVAPVINRELKRPSTGGRGTRPVARHVRHRICLAVPHKPDQPPSTPPSAAAGGVGPIYQSLDRHSPPGRSRMLRWVAQRTGVLHFEPRGVPRRSGGCWARVRGVGGAVPESTPRSGRGRGGRASGRAWRGGREYRWPRCPRPTASKWCRSPADCIDGFNWAYWRRPHAYLDPEVRACNRGWHCSMTNWWPSGGTSWRRSRRRDVGRTPPGHLLGLDSVDRWISGWWVRHLMRQQDIDLTDLDRFVGGFSRRRLHRAAPPSAGVVANPRTVIPRGERRLLGGQQVMRTSRRRGRRGDGSRRPERPGPTAAGRSSKISLGFAAGVLLNMMGRPSPSTDPAPGDAGRASGAPWPSWRVSYGAARPSSRTPWPTRAGCDLPHGRRPSSCPCRPRPCSWGAERGPPRPDGVVGASLTYDDRELGGTSSAYRGVRRHGRLRIALLAGKKSNGGDASWPNGGRRCHRGGDGTAGPLSESGAADVLHLPRRRRERDHP